MSAIDPAHSVGGGAIVPLTDEQLTLLTLRFEENEFGYLPSEAVTTNSAATSAAANEAKGLPPTELPAVSTAFVPFSAYDFVREKQEHMSLEDLSSDLSTFSRLTEAKIMRHIHEDVHAAFVTVSGQLGNMVEPLARALQPLQTARNRLAKSLNHLEQADAKVTEALTDAQRHEAGRQFQVGLLQIELTFEEACRVYHTVAAAQVGMHLVLPPGAVAGGPRAGYSVRHCPTSSTASTAGALSAADESTLRPKGWSGASAEMGIDRHDALIETLAQHVGRLRAMWAALPLAASFCKPLKGLSGAPLSAAVGAIEGARRGRREAFEMLEEANKALQLVLGTALYDAYLSTLANSSCVALGTEAAVGTDVATALRRFSQLLGVYRTLGDERELAVVYRDVVVRPLVEGVVSWRAVGEARKSTAMVAQILRGIKDLLEKKVLHIVPLLRDAFGSAINPIADIMWTAVCDTLVKRLVFLFSPTLPDVLHSNYTAAQEILALLEANCGSPQELFALRSGPDMTMWLRKWNLDVYLVQRTQEATESFNKLFAETESLPPTAEPAPIAPVNASGLTAAAADSPAVQSAVSASIYRYHYAPLFEGLSELAVRPFTKGSFLLPLGARQTRLAVTMVHNGLTRTVNKALQQAGSSSSPSPSSSSASEAVTHFAPLCYLLKDLSQFELFIKNDFVSIAKAALGEAYGAASPSHAHAEGHAMVSLFKIVVGCVSERRKSLVASLRQMLLDGAMGPLQQGLMAASTRANVPTSPCPTEASRYVVEAVSSLLQFQQLVEGGFIGETDCAVILCGVGRDLCAQYQTAVSNALQALYRRLKALQKVKRAAAGGGSASAAASSTEVTDFEKMVLQMYYDAVHLETKLAPYISVPFSATAAGAAVGDEAPLSVFRYYFEPLVVRGAWIIANKVNGGRDLSDAVVPPLWPEVNES